MTRTAYTYRVVRYVHDPAVGEALNIGVVLCAPKVRFFGGMFEHRYERLSDAFGDFDGDRYRRVLKQMEVAIGDLTAYSAESHLFQTRSMPKDVNEMTTHLVPDTGLSIQFGTMLAGITEDAEEALAVIFDRMVASQYPRRRHEQRTDDQVWQDYRKRLAQHRITPHLQPKTFASDAYDLRFEHTFKNERWHVLQPVTMDYAKGDSLQQRATRILGTAAALTGNKELGKLYLLLGAPRTESLRGRYDKAKNLLHKIPVPHEIIEESEAEDFAKHLEEYMREHGVIGGQ